MTNTPRAAVPAALALYLALVQFLFVSTWTIYVIFLPGLLATAGLSPALVPTLLMVDQLVFMASDICVGVAADRVQRALGRLAPLIIGLTVLSCGAFLLLPYAVRLGNAAPGMALALIFIWLVTSSALRAPPWVLLSRHAARPSLPRLNTLLLCGLAAAGAAAPYLGVVLKNVDPRLPFALSSLTLLAATAGIVQVERRLKLSPPAPTSALADAPQVVKRSWAFLLALLLLAAGFQVHFSINTASQFLRFAQPADLEWLMPVFWVGFGVAMMPGSALCKRHGMLPVIAVAAVLGAVAAWAAARAPTLETLIAAQLVAGGAWGTMLMCGFTAAMAAGRSGREGLALGLLFAVLAAANLARIGVAAAGLLKLPAYAELFAQVPVALWLAGALLSFILALRTRRATPHPADA